MRQHLADFESRQRKNVTSLQTRLRQAKNGREAAVVEPEAEAEGGASSEAASTAAAAVDLSSPLSSEEEEERTGNLEGHIPKKSGSAAVGTELRIPSASELVVGNISQHMARLHRLHCAAVTVQSFVRGWIARGGQA